MEGEESKKPTTQPTLNQEMDQSNTLAETTEREFPGTDKAKMKYPVVIPNAKVVSDKIRRVMKGYRIQVCFRPTNTLH